MATLTTYASDDGEVNTGNATYATAHDAATADAVDITSEYNNLGQDLSAGLKYVHRWGLFFDTSALTAIATISAATLTLWCYWNRIATTNWNVTVVSGTGLASPVVAGDYGDLLAATTSYGATTTSGLVDNGSLVITLNSTGIANISKTGTTAFGLRSSRDISSSAPTDRELVLFYTSRETEVAEYRPTLTITYATDAVPFQISIVETQLHYVDFYGVERYIEGTIVT